MAAGPQRRTTPVAHLGAHIVPVERALLERARALDEQAAELRKDPDSHLKSPSPVLPEFVAAEFRALVAELHFWG